MFLWHLWEESVLSVKAAETYPFSVVRTPLHAAAFADHVECLQLLLRHSAHVNAEDDAGRTALMMAAENGQAGAVGMCLACGLLFYACPKPEQGKIKKSVILWYMLTERPTF